jgi:ribosomal protein S24E
MKIINEKENALLKRKEFLIAKNYDENPGIENVKKDLTEFLKVDEGKIFVRKINSYFGRSDFVIDVFVYDSVELKNKMEKTKKKKEKKKN